MLHLIKLAVGIRDIAHLGEAQAARAAAEPPLRHRTRQWPKRSAELIDGGSIYWVIAGRVQCRQRISDLRQDHYPDASACAALILDPALVPVEPRLTKPFQGWRYLRGEDAPADLGPDAALGQDLPASLRLALRELCLL
ncbi:DUF1489 family protein [Acidisoma sp. C75]